MLQKGRSGILQPRGQMVIDCILHNIYCSPLRGTTCPCPTDIRLAHVTYFSQQNEGKSGMCHFPAKARRGFPSCRETCYCLKQGQFLQPGPQSEEHRSRAPPAVGAELSQLCCHKSPRNQLRCHKSPRCGYCYHSTTQPKLARLNLLVKSLDCFTCLVFPLLLSICLVKAAQLKLAGLGFYS